MENLTMENLTVDELSVIDAGGIGSAISATVGTIAIGGAMASSVYWGPVAGAGVLIAGAMGLGNGILNN